MFQGATGIDPSQVGGQNGFPGGGGDYTPETWNLDVNLSPEQQAIFESQQRAQGGRSGLAEDAVGRAGAALGQPIESGMDARNRAEQAIYGRAASRLDPRFQQQEEQYRTRLYNQGLREGDEAYGQQMGEFGRTRNDAYQNAMNESIMGGGQEMSRQFTQGLQGRSALLNELQSLMSGGQVGMPQQPNVPGAGGSAPPDLMGAAGQQYGANVNQYNAQQAQQQSMQNMAMMLPFLFSDERLKTDIRRHEYEVLPGVPFASWRWKAGGHGYGVIAQDLQKVRPDLVVEGPDGFLMVNYGGLR
ncbi:MAG: tail fiber domain-containing protein [Thermodesulfovibrionales bacterium]